MDPSDTGSFVMSAATRASLDLSRASPGAAHASDVTSKATLRTRRLRRMAATGPDHAPSSRAVPPYPCRFGHKSSTVLGARDLSQPAMPALRTFMRLSGPSPDSSPDDPLRVLRRRTP